MISGRSILAICLCIATLSSYAEPSRVTNGVSKHEPDAKGDGKNKQNAVIYLSPGERDAADGTSPDSALSELQAAIDMADKKFDEGYRDVTVRVLPGRYQAQTAKTAGPGEGKRLVITAAGENGKAIFDGTGKVDTWLTISGRIGQPTNLVVSGFRIMNYITAITMNGSRDKLDNAVSQVEIKKNVFESIGQSRAGDKPSTAVIRLVNSDNNQIVGNRFVHYRNLQQCGLLHAIYVAHNSTGNLIKDNEFEDGCGDAIRFRDTSSNNIVQNNSFDDAWQNAPITDWYCDASSRSDCTKSSGECPSVDNRLVANRMVAHRAQNKGLTAEFGALDTKLCPSSVHAKRFIQQ